MSLVGYCPNCKQMCILDEHRCPPTWLVAEEEDLDESDAAWQLVYALNAKEAARCCIRRWEELWGALWEDAEYIVHVQPGEGGDTQRFAVVPVTSRGYVARLVPK